MTLDGIELPDDLLWVDEFDWNPVAQDIDRSLTGALMVQEQTKLYGRPITLTGGDEAGWVTRATLLKLENLNNLSNKLMTLILDRSRSFSVVFDRRELRHIEVYQILPEAYPVAKTLYSITLRFLTL